MHIAITTLWFPHDKNPLYGIFIQSQAVALASMLMLLFWFVEEKYFHILKNITVGKVNVIEKRRAISTKYNDYRLEKWSNYYMSMFEEVEKLKKVDVYSLP